MAYNWQLPEWPNFNHDINKLQGLLMQYAQNIGQIDGELSHLSSEEQLTITLQLMVDEAVKTSEIEGEYISREDVMSSIRIHLGLDINKDLPKDARALGIAAMMKMARQHYDEPLSEKMLFNWHGKLLGYAKDISPLIIGGWREHTEPMQVISGRPGKITVHYEAPPSKDIPHEMKGFIEWFNTSDSDAHQMPAPIRAGIAHLYYESIHPFEDGNGRIGRTLSEKALSQQFGKPIPFSISSCIQPERKRYYAALKQAQSTMDITEWLVYFIEMLIAAQGQSRTMIDFILRKTAYLEKHSPSLSARQHKVIKRMLDAGPDGFEGGMTAKKYMAITKCSKATATRDLCDLVIKEVLYEQGGAGPTVHYGLTL